MYYVYILRCEDNSLYTGITTDLERRFREHRERTTTHSKYTASHTPIAPQRVWQAADRSAASRLEYYIKTLTKSKKEALIQDPSLLSDYFKDKLDASEYVLQP